MSGGMSPPRRRRNDALSVSGDGGVPHDEVSDGVVESLLDAIPTSSEGRGDQEHLSSAKAAAPPDPEANTSPRQLAETARVGMVSPEAFQDGLAALDALLAELEQAKRRIAELEQAFDLRAELHWKDKAELEQVKKERDGWRSCAEDANGNLFVWRVEKAEAERDRLAEALEWALGKSERGFYRLPEVMRGELRRLASMEGDK